MINLLLFQIFIFARPQIGIGYFHHPKYAPSMELVQNRLLRWAERVGESADIKIISKDLGQKIYPTQMQMTLLEKSLLSFQRKLLVESVLDHSINENWNELRSSIESLEINKKTSQAFFQSYYLTQALFFWRQGEMSQAKRAMQQVYKFISTQTMDLSQLEWEAIGFDFVNFKKEFEKQKMLFPKSSTLKSEEDGVSSLHIFFDSEAIDLLIYFQLTPKKDIVFYMVSKNSSSTTELLSQKKMTIEDVEKGFIKELDLDSTALSEWLIQKDFNDKLVKVDDLFESSPNLKSSWYNKWQYWCVGGIVVTALSYAILSGGGEKKVSREVSSVRLEIQLD